MSATEEAAKIKCVEHMTWWDTHLNTLTSRVRAKELCSCVEKHDMPNSPNSVARPWHMHMVIYFHNRVTKSQNLWRALCTPFY